MVRLRGRGLPRPGAGVSGAGAPVRASGGLW